ncbi:Uncharacterised protein [Mycobacteroides abscessus subsp. abscessus]|nr:Uncharacterised protein [Mycobacteroides abscessus subsp. abscessus]
MSAVPARAPVPMTIWRALTVTVPASLPTCTVLASRNVAVPMSTVTDGMLSSAARLAERSPAVRRSVVATAAA